MGTVDLSFPSLRRGFTLVELLVGIAIIGVLATGVIVLINPLAQIQKANDAKRKSDLSEIQKGLEAYYADNGKYPDTLTLDSVYMGTVPNDSNSAKTYGYRTDLNGQAYYLYASLDRGESDLQACNADGSACLGSEGVSCGEGACNYGVSSPNVNVAFAVMPTAAPPLPTSPVPTSILTSTPILTPTPTVTPIPTITPTIIVPTPTPVNYVFNANITYDTAYGGSVTYEGIYIYYTALTQIKLNSVTGNVPSFQVIIAVSGVTDDAYQSPVNRSTQKLIGPVSNFNWTPAYLNINGMLYDYFTYPSITIWANPDPNVSFPNEPAGNWQVIGSAELRHANW
jgi:general secretion pathway protein G